MRNIKTVFIILLCFLCKTFTASSQTPVHNPNEITFDNLLKKMTDRDALARYPAGKWTLHH